MLGLRTVVSSFSELAETLAEYLLMDGMSMVAGGSASANLQAGVAVQKQAQKQQETVVNTIIQSACNDNGSRLNVYA